ncbi:GNAT family N-acetyltransferase, partial [Enterococcus faecalis]
MFIDQQVIIKKISNIDVKEKALVRAFSCGKDHIDSYLKDEALEDVIYGITKTFLLFITSEDSPTFLLVFFSLTTDRVVVTKK